MANMKNVGGINLKVRMKKKSFWVAVLSVLVATANGLGNAFGVDLLPFTEQVEAVAMATLGVLILMGVVVDGTTKGLKDTPRAQDYDNPNDGQEYYEE